jgi:phosphoglycerol transferase MdoB-like AlkP superfamily enzyme
MKNEQNAFMILLLVIMLGMTGLSFRFSSGSRMLPMISGICSSAILAFLIAMTFSSRLASWYGKFEKKALLSDEKMTKEERKKEISIVAWFVGGTVLVYLVGFIFSIPAFLFLFLKWRAKEKWLVSILVPLVVTAVVYFVFMWVLSVPLYEGVFFE